ncbi:MAG TPA: glycoside hydrolase family 32 protein [Candidatus Binatia bacterium]|nr:glycoside hydrolase family 32 protein [Candidatus Binatia bacterium]
MTRIHHLALVGFLLLPLYSRSETSREAIARATAAVAAATPRAQADPAHPIFHVASPAQWMNDPNGPIFYRGYYHLFYQLTPFSDQSGVKYWGHVRSRDLVKWEHLPIAIAPSDDLGEASIWSGCCTINGEGRPMIFYTSIGKGKSPFDQAEQWAATSDDNLIHWQKSSANPVLTDAVNNGTNIYDWRDPFIFKDGGKTFMVLGGHLAKDGQAAVNIYEAENPAFTQWKYRGVLFQIPGAPTAECPNFFKLGDEWVLFVSPYGKVQYFIGSFDATTCRFTAHTNGLLDYGPDFYAPNTMQLSDGRRLVWGWVKGFPDGRGWNGCLSLPRQLSLSPDGRLCQKPAPQLHRLRGQPARLQNVSLTDHPEMLSLPRTNTLEIQAELELKTAKGVALELRSDAETGPAITVRLDRENLKVLGINAPLHSAGKLNLRIFLDRSVVEIFANDSVCITKTIQPPGSNATLEIHALGGKASLQRLDAWPMKTIW